ncbi:glycosyltransferase family 4 protein [Flavobacterium sp. '19STA2R22 D10 B1']|uniref:glycosyltransferase family 4 protein n=1 Tax=Flavobacterium aerium TaxID=3037261 RepID=UPI00278C1FD3|nr:glycosyltransferase family 4 protein [Flavobacterium sp. '19STA2R22 D10 B1']
MTVLFFTNEYNHPKLPPVGGLGTFIKTLSTELTKRGHQVIIFGQSKKNGIHFFDEQIEVKMIQDYRKNIPFAKHINSILKRIGFGLFLPMRERKYIAREFHKFISSSDKKVDLIEANDFGGYFIELGNEIPLIIRCHGSATLFNTYFSYRFSPIIEQLEKQSFKMVDDIIAVSKFSASSTATVFDKAKIDVIYNGIDTNIFNPKDSSPIIPYSIFFHGNLIEQKGVKIICEVFNEIIKAQPKATLHLIGRGKKYWNYLREHVLTHPDSAFYYDSIEYTQLPKVISQANVALFPSFGENLPLVILEAMAMEKPVVMSNIGVSQEIIEHGIDGYIANNQGEYVQTILDLFNNPDLAQSIGQKAREKVVAKFSNDRMVDESIDYYQKIITQKTI